MKKTLAFLLSLFTAMVMIFCVPMSDSDVEADVVCTPLQKKVQEVAAEMRGLTRPQLNSKYNAGIPNTNWCGYYSDLVLKESFKRLGYEDYGNYYPTQDLFGSVTVSRYVENDTRWAQKYTWNDWSYSGKSGYKTNNISSYVPRIGDVITINVNGDSNPDPDHIAIIVRVNNDNSFVTSEGNTGSKQSLDNRTVKEYTYSRSDKSSAFSGPVGQVVCALRPHDPTGSVISSGTPWDNGDFYAYIILKDGWKHTGVSEDNNLQILNNDSEDTREIFHCVPAGGGEYVIFNEYNGYCLDVYNNGVSVGTNIGLYPCHDGAADNQRWYIYQTPNGYILRPKHCDLVMTSVGGNIQLAVLTGDSSQLFSVYPLENDNTHYVKPNLPKTFLSVSASCVRINDNISFSWEPVPVTSKFDKRMYYVDIFNEKGEWRYTYELGSEVTNINGSFDETGLFFWRIRTANVKYKDYWSTSNVVSVEVVDGEIVLAEANVIDVPDFPITGPEDLTLEAVATDPIGDVKIVEPLAPMATITTAAAPAATAVPKPTATATSKSMTTTTPKATATPKPVVTTPTVTPKPEVKDFVERLYGVALGRESDEEGLDYWVDQVKKNDMTGGDLAKNFLFSDEFLCKNVSYEAFVETLYKTFFDRESEVDGKAYWVDQLKSGVMDKQAVIEGFINSNEWGTLCASYGIASVGTVKSSVNIEPNEQVVAFATRLYTTCLGREPEVDGLEYWANELTNRRVSGTIAALGFFFSDEFVGKNFSNEEYVRRLYLTFMDRDCDQDGFNYWVCQLNSGAATRVDVFNGFSVSPEFDNICVSFGIFR